MSKKYKDWLFVKVQPGAKWFGIGNMNDLHYSTDEHEDYVWPLPPGSWQIIGKGDAIDWEGIVEKIASQNKYSGYPIGNWYMDYERKKPALFKTATESGHSLLKSLGMEPGTTLVLKKNEK